MASIVVKAVDSHVSVQFVANERFVPGLTLNLTDALNTAFKLYNAAHEAYKCEKRSIFSRDSFNVGREGEYDLIITHLRDNKVDSLYDRYDKSENWQPGDAKLIPEVALDLAFKILVNSHIQQVGLIEKSSKLAADNKAHIDALISAVDKQRHEAEYRAELLAVLLEELERDEDSDPAPQTTQRRPKTPAGPIGELVKRELSMATRADFGH